MIEYKLSLASSGAVKTPGSMDALQLGYSRNCGVYRLRVSTADEWKGMTLRAFWHTPGGSPPASLVEDGVVEVPALVTAVPGEGCITFEGSDGVRTLTSADLRYRVAANSGTEDGTLPPPGTPAWQQLVGQMEGAGADVEKSAARAETAQSSASDSAAAAARSLKTLQEGIASGSFKGEKGDPGARGAQGPKGDTGPQGPRGQTGAAGKAVEVDATLAMSGAAADAKAVGSALAGKAAASHTHSYAGSSSAGGTANSVNGFTFAAQTADPGAGSSLATNKVLIVYA